MQSVKSKARATNTPGLVKKCSCRWLTVPLASIAFLVMGSVPPAHAQTYTFTTLYNFTGTNGDGALPADIGGLIMDSSGNLYGTTQEGGTVNSGCNNGFGPSCGTVFKLDTHGHETVLHRFNADDGSTPFSGVIIDGSNNLYGTTTFGGSSTNCNAGCGTVFKVDTNGNNFTVLHSFTGLSSTGLGDGEFPFGGLIMGTQSGILYGTTLADVFTLDLSSDVESTVYIPIGPPNDGSNVQGSLVMDSAGNLYGTTLKGGSSTTSCPADPGGCGTVFKVDPSGNETVLHSFDLSDGANPEEGLVLDGSGNLYGTTAFGGSSTNCNRGCGTVFKLDTNGNNFTVLHNFTSANGDGANPVASLIIDASGNLYGTTTAGGSSGNGTVFKLDANGNNFTVLHSFNFNDGSSPGGPLLRDASGNLYGTASGGGSYNNGTVFEMSPTVPFSAFNAKLDFTSARSPGFQLNATLTQGAGATAINPVQQGMTLTVGTYTVMIPAGSFQTHMKGVYAYQGTINGVALQVRISQTGTSSYRVQVDASGVNLSTLTNPVAVTLTLGQNSGTANVTAEF